ncbi:MAG: LPXTG cell wall anchor domain-containing protein [Candidatus Saccharibacteria bacterium]|nr:LPXTG cell wall anchor domain-containing protein [Candidatus Saccharibacteria bacterium]
MKQNQYQRGAAGSFIIIAVVLTLVALTVLYGARQFMSQQSAPITAQDIAPRPHQQSAQAPEVTKPNTDTSPAPQTSGSTQQQSSTPQSSQPSRATDRQVATVPQQSAPHADQPSAGVPSQHLPQTGPVSAVASAAGMATLAGLATLYVRSRRLI